MEIDENGGVFCEAPDAFIFDLGAWDGLRELQGIFHERLGYMPRVETHDEVTYDLYTERSMRI